MTYQKMVEDIFMRQPWQIAYDDMEFEVNVVRLSEEHHIRRIDNAGLDHRLAFRSIFRLLSEITWMYNCPAQFVGGSHGKHMVEATYSIRDERYLGNFSQKIADELQHLALGFYREAECTDSPYYRFMCLSKIIEIPFEDGKKKGAWLERVTAELTDEVAVTFRDKRLHSLTEKTLAGWLFESRNKVAHAHNGRPTSDPNNFDDWDEMQWGNRVLEELAIRAIVEELGAPPNWTYLNINK